MDRARGMDCTTDNSSSSSASNNNEAIESLSSWAFDIPFNGPNEGSVLGSAFDSPSLKPPVDEENEIKLVHALVTCAESVKNADLAKAGFLIKDMQCHLLPLVNTRQGIGKVASSFIKALTRRVFSSSSLSELSPIIEDHVLYHQFYEASPCLKFAHFTANQWILEAFDGHEKVHVVDLNLMQGLQWPALIQALALRPGGPPAIRLTGINPPCPEIGPSLADLARSMNVRFTFRGLQVSHLEDIKPWTTLQLSSKEALAINSIMQLHKLIEPSPRNHSLSPSSSPIELVLSWARMVGPRIVTVVEQEANHNVDDFLHRFTEALNYYSTMFDSLEAGGTQEKALAEMYVQKEIMNVIGCEGEARFERHEPFDAWRRRMSAAGFEPVLLGENAFKQASVLLNMSSAEGYCVNENEGCLTLGWHGRPLISASAWRPNAI